MGVEDLPMRTEQVFRASNGGGLPQALAVVTWVEAIGPRPKSPFQNRAEFCSFSGSQRP